MGSRLGSHGVCPPFFPSSRLWVAESEQGQQTPWGSTAFLRVPGLALRPQGASWSGSNTSECLFSLSLGLGIRHRTAGLALPWPRGHQAGSVSSRL